MYILVLMNVKGEMRRERITSLTRANPTINSKKIRRDALGMRTYDIGFMLFRCLLFLIYDISSSCLEIESIQENSL